MASWWTIILNSSILSAVVVTPLLYHQYIYPTAGDDTASHLIYFKYINSQEPLYFGQYIVGKLFNSLPVDVVNAFNWFHYIVFIVAVWVIGLVVALSVGVMAGVFAQMMSVYGTSQAINLFYYGQIFDIIGIMILLPIAIMCLHNAYKNVYWKLLCVVVLVAFCLFHANGLYLYALLPIIVIYESLRLIVGKKLSGLPLELWANRFTVYTGFLGIVLIILAFVGVGQPDPNRLFMDSSILLSLSAASAIYIMMRVFKAHNVAYVAVVVIMLIITIPNMITWLQYNSAVRNEDKQAIVYLNSLKGSNYTTSKLVSSDIYGLYVNKNYVDAIYVEYLIDRTEPMTPRTDPNNVYFQNRGLDFDNEAIRRRFDLLEEFNEGNQLTVSIYRRINY